MPRSSESHLFGKLLLINIFLVWRVSLAFHSLILSIDSLHLHEN